MKRCLGIILLILLWMPHFGYGVILHVPTDYPTIQEGVDAASNGDTVLVADGTYTGPGNKDIQLGGKAITVSSEHGAAYCVIDCEGDGRAFCVCSGEGPDSIIQGFTILNGYATDVFPLLGGDSGGGILCDRASPTIIDCVFIDNYAEFWGGAIWCVDSTAQIIDCSFSQNVAEHGGGSIGLFFSDASITNCQITDSSAQWGGGICTHTASPRITNSVIARNTANLGAGIYGWAQSFPLIVNSTLVDNQAIDNGSGVASGKESGPTLTNCILWDIGEEVYQDATSSVSISYSDIRGGHTGPNNIDADPLFVGTNDLHLSDSSPCIGAGTMTADVPGTDLDGLVRPNPAGSNPDMGAYEHPLALPEEQTGSIHGIVTDHDGQSLRAALVVVLDAATKEQSVVVTDVNGSYTHMGLAAGSYHVLCLKKGYALSYELNVTIPPDRAVNFTLTPE